MFVNKLAWGTWSITETILQGSQPSPSILSPGFSPLTVTQAGLQPSQTVNSTPKTLLLVLTGQVRTLLLHMALPSLVAYLLGSQHWSCPLCVHVRNPSPGLEPDLHITSPQLPPATVSLSFLFPEASGYAGCLWGSHSQKVVCRPLPTSQNQEGCLGKNMASLTHISPPKEELPGEGHSNLYFYCASQVFLK